MATRIQTPEFTKSDSKRIQTTFLKQVSTLLKKGTDLSSEDRKQIRDELERDLYPMMWVPTRKGLEIISGVGIPRGFASLTLIFEDTVSCSIDEPNPNRSQTWAFCHYWSTTPPEDEPSAIFDGDDGAEIRVADMEFALLASIVYSIVKRRNANSAFPAELAQACADELFRRLLSTLLGKLKKIRFMVQKGELVPALILVIPKADSGKALQYCATVKEVAVSPEIAVAIRPELQDFFPEHRRAI